MLLLNLVTIVLYIKIESEGKQLDVSPIDITTGDRWDLEGGVRLYAQVHYIPIVNLMCTFKAQVVKSDVLPQTDLEKIWEYLVAVMRPKIKDSCILLTSQRTVISF